MKYVHIVPADVPFGAEEYADAMVILTKTITSGIGTTMISPGYNFRIKL